MSGAPWPSATRWASSRIPEQDQAFAPKVVADISFAYRFPEAMELQVGANNVFDVYPDEARDPRLTNDGTVPYSRLATQSSSTGRPVRRAEL